LFFDKSQETVKFLSPVSGKIVEGCWPFVKQRPYDVIADPEKSPKAIFISGYASAPLAADLDFTLQGKVTFNR